MDYLTGKAQTLINVTSAGAQQVIEEGGAAAAAGLTAVKNQVNALQGAIEAVITCAWVTGVLRFVDGIAVAIILVTILQALRSKHRFIPSAANDAFNKLGNLIGVPKHSADVMRHLKQLGMLFVVVVIIRAIANAHFKSCVDTLFKETMVLQGMVEANADLEGRVMRIVQAIKDARAPKAGGDAEGQ